MLMAASAWLAPGVGFGQREFDQCEQIGAVGGQHGEWSLRAAVVLILRQRP